MAKKLRSLSTSGKAIYSDSAVGNAVRAAYAKSNLLEKRAEMLRDWSSFLAAT